MIPFRYPSRAEVVPAPAKTTPLSETVTPYPTVAIPMLDTLRI